MDVAKTSIDEMLEVLGEVWRQVAPRLPFEPDTPWHASGVDSLKSLQFILRLETRIGMSVALDLLTPDTTPRILAVQLADETAMAPVATAHMFVVPGLLGDELTLAAFRRGTADLAHYDLVELPDLETPAATLRDIPASAALLADAIAARQPDGPLRLAGYSMGGIVALEAAQVLRARGRDVALLVLLDPFLKIDPRKPFRRAENATKRPALRVVALGGWKTSPRRIAERLVFGGLLLSGGLEGARRYLFRIRDRLPADTLHWRRLRLIGRLRWIALRRWQPQPWDGSTLIAISEEAPLHYDVRAWTHLCPGARRVMVPASHLDLFDPAGMAVLHPALAAALEPSTAA